jgi:2-polyprenyl-6-methoxyphenol hydroxylase-like FAD-dependent oxidoreductase
MLRVLIAGGGIGGLTAALHLRRRGFEVEIFEAAPEIRELGLGINIQPHGVRDLVAVGLAEAIARDSCAVAKLAYFNKHGQEIWHEPRGREAGYLYQQAAINRGRLQGLLLEAVSAALGPDRIHAGHRLERFEQSEQEVVVHFAAGPDGQRPSSRRGDILVGADGIHSAVRKTFYPNEGLPKFGGQIMWRGISRVRPFFDSRTMIMAGHRDKKVVVYPVDAAVGEDGLINVNWVAEDTITDSMPPREDWNRQASVPDVAARFVDWRFSWLDVPTVLAAAPTCYEFPKVDRDPVTQWSFGRVTLLGDAAHPMHPAGSNGATQAIIDAPALADSLAEGGNPVAALRAYQDKRLPVLAELVRINREKMGPESVMILAEQRAPNGFTNVLDVLTQEELDNASNAYKAAAGAERAKG